MAIERVLLVIADIGGYTRFMNLHRWSLAHAQDVVARLLDSVIGSSGGMFEVAKLEGDAVFLFARVGGSDADFAPFARQIYLMREAFLSRLQEINTNRLCNCDGCVGAARLKLKFVSHYGEAAFQKIRQFVELAGVDVILVHRMLKNSVPVGEYVLMTEPVKSRLEPHLMEMSKPLEEEFEGLGRHVTHYIDLNDMALVQLPAPKPGWWKRAFAWVALFTRTLPYVLGLRKPLEGHRHLPEITGEAMAPSPEPLGEGVR
jgi:hypothetical protein